MKKHILCLVLVVLFVLCLSSTAFAATAIIYDSADDLYDYLKNYKKYDVTLDGKTITLQADVKLEDTLLIFASGAGDELEVVIDLNGKKISGQADYIIAVEKGILTITDSSAGGGGTIENTIAENVGALCVSDTGKLNVNGGTTKAPFGLLQIGGECVIRGGTVAGQVCGVFVLDGACQVSGGELRGGLSALNLGKGTCDIEGGTFNGELYGISATGGQLTLSGRFAVTAERWDGVRVENMDVNFENIVDASITALRYGITAQNGNISINNVISKFRVDGFAAAVMLEAKNDDYAVQLTKAVIGAEKLELVTTSFAGRDNPVCTSFSTEAELSQMSWKDLSADAVMIPAGARLVTFSAEVDPDAEAPSSWAVQDINEAAALKLIPSELNSAYGQQITRAEFCALAVMLYEKVSGKEITERQTFADTTDVNVQKMGALGIVNGVGEDQFAPDALLTREQAATMLARLAEAIGKPLPEKAATFADNASISTWAIVQVGQVQEAGIMNGVSDTMFSPQGKYTREQSIVTMLRLYQVVK